MIARAASLNPIKLSATDILRLGPAGSGRWIAERFSRSNIAVLAVCACRGPSSLSVDLGRPTSSCLPVCPYYAWVIKNLSGALYTYTVEAKLPLLWRHPNWT